MPIFNFGQSKRSTQFGRVDVPFEPWLRTQNKEEPLRPDLPIIDPHHHLWDYPGYRYLVPEFSADLAGGHHVLSTV